MVFLGTLEKLFGLGYDTHDEWASRERSLRRSRLTPVAVIVAIASTGYALGRPGERQLDLPLTGQPVAGEAAG